jgi:hypothetical protein
MLNFIGYPAKLGHKLRRVHKLTLDARLAVGHAGQEPT